MTELKDKIINYIQEEKNYEEQKSLLMRFIYALDDKIKKEPSSKKEYTILVKDLLINFENLVDKYLIYKYYWYTNLNINILENIINKKPLYRHVKKELKVKCKSCNTEFICEFNSRQDFKYNKENNKIKCNFCIEKENIKRRKEIDKIEEERVLKNLYIDGIKIIFNKFEVEEDDENYDNVISLHDVDELKNYLPIENQSINFEFVIDKNFEEIDLIKYNLAIYGLSFKCININNDKQKVIVNSLSFSKNIRKTIIVKDVIYNIALETLKILNKIKSSNIDYKKDFMEFYFNKIINKDNIKEIKYDVKYLKMIYNDYFKNNNTIDNNLYQQTLDYFKSLPYKEYLKTEHWQHFRKEAVKYFQGKCQLCNSEESLNLHHRTYENLGRETFNDVILLCKDCHGKFHGFN